VSKVVGVAALALLCLSQCASIRAFGLLSDHAVASPDFSRTDVPFELRGHALVLNGIVIGEHHGPHEFIFDTKSINFVDGALAREMSLGLRSEIEARDVNGGAQTIGLAKLGGLTLGNYATSNVTVGVMDLSFLQDMTGSRIDGILGSSFFIKQNVQVDYAAKTLKVSNTRFTERDHCPYAVDSALDIRNAFAPSFPLRVDGEYDLTAVLDTGAVHSMMPSKWILEHQKHNPEDVVASHGSMVLTRSKSDGTSSLAVRIRTIEFAGQQLRDLVMLSNMQDTVLIGYDILRNFTLDIDYSIKKLCFVRNGVEKYDHNILSYGFRCARGGSSRQIVVSGVWHHSPADRAGIQPNDVVTDIDSVPVGGLSLREVEQLLEDRSEPIGVGFERNGKKFVAALSKEEVIK
jgi:hypothetical protein